MKEFTRAAQALSDETRLRIVNLIMNQESCVCEVMQALNISQTRASRNLKVLYDAGFLEMRSDGLYTLYSLKKGRENGFHTDMLEVVKKNIGSKEITRKDLERLNKAERVGPGCAGKR
jgi:ArsR family transcriptional regulator